MRETRTSAQAMDANATEAPEGANPDARVTPSAPPPSPPRAAPPARSPDPARPRAASTPTQKGMPALTTPTSRSARPPSTPTLLASKSNARPTVALPPSVPSAAGKSTTWQSNPTSLQLALRLRQGPLPALPPMPPEPLDEPEPVLQKPDDPRAPNTGVDWFLGTSGDEVPETPAAPPRVQPAPEHRPEGLDDPVALLHPPAVPPFVEPPRAVSGSSPPRAAPVPYPSPSHPPGPSALSSLAEHHLPPDLDLRAEHPGHAGLAAAAARPTSETLQTDELWVPTSASFGRPSAMTIPLVRTQWRPLETAKTVSMLLIGLAFLLPTAAGPPWSLLLAPAEVTFIAFVSLLSMGVVHVLPLRPPTRHKLALGLALLLVPFAVLTLCDAVAADHFDGQPFLTHLGHTPLLAATLLVGAASLVAGLTLAPTSNDTAYRLAIAVGLALLITVALVPMASPDARADAVPLASAFASMGDGPFFGDRVAAFALLPTLLLAGLAVIVAIGPLRRFGAPLGVSAWVTLTLPFVLLSLFVFRPTDWLEVMAPLKTTLYLAGVALFLAASLGAVLDRSNSLTRADSE